MLIDPTVAKGGSEKEVMEMIRKAWTSLGFGPVLNQQSLFGGNFKMAQPMPVYDVNIFMINYYKMYVKIQNLLTEVKKMMTDVHESGKHSMNLSKYADKVAYGLGIFTIGLQLYEAFSSQKSEFWSYVRSINSALMFGYLFTMGHNSKEKALYKKFERIQRIVKSAGWLDTMLKNYFKVFIDEFDSSIFTREEFDSDRVKEYMCYLIFTNNIKYDPMIFESRYLQESLLRKLYATYNTDIFPLWWYKKKCEHLLKDADIRKTDALDCLESHVNSVFIHGLPVLCKFKVYFSIPYLMGLKMIDFKDDEDKVAKYNSVCESNVEMVKQLENIQLTK